MVVLLSLLCRVTLLVFRVTSEIHYDFYDY